MRITRKFVVCSVLVIISVLASTTLIACGGGTTSTTTTNPPTTTTAPPTTSPGAALYKASCAVCHGENRQGVTSGTTVIGPAVLVTSPTITKFTTEASLATFIAGHQTGKNLTADQNTQIAQFLKAP
ncbi:hypothetical protein Dform_01284 [Dehalogenimonas formicexedens]|uniref:Cytochrome c domain-containing protein n=1 Tax=Dehalogenimonas formicexedens TaxID=1839801 RepID=A0A1P8F886_9CHLR|nr:hypothetical protein Dform_01284 [Dehalogenimonas formicexedens]